MQFAKDSFYVALRERLAALNPARTVTFNGVTIPAVIVGENEPNSAAARLPDAFYIEWGAAKPVKGHEGSPLLMELEGSIRFCTLGTCESGVDRGRTMAALERELISICQPATTPKTDFSQSPSVQLGTSVFWTLPQSDEIIAAKDAATQRNMGARRERRARLNVFFFPEVDLP